MCQRGQRGFFRPGPTLSLRRQLHHIRVPVPWRSNVDFPVVCYSWRPCCPLHRLCRRIFSLHRFAAKVFQLPLQHHIPGKPICAQSTCRLNDRMTHTQLPVSGNRSATGRANLVPRLSDAVRLTCSVQESAMLACESVSQAARRHIPPRQVCLYATKAEQAFEDFKEMKMLSLKTPSCFCFTVCYPFPVH